MQDKDYYLDVGSVILNDDFSLLLFYSAFAAKSPQYTVIAVEEYFTKE